MKHDVDLCGNIKKRTCEECGCEWKDNNPFCPNRDCPENQNPQEPVEDE